MTNRIITLDYLRGIAAVIVMVGHYFGWVTEPVETPILLHKLVTFSVSIFYILSGITLYTVYKDQFEFRLSKSSLQSFYAFAIKRMFRILPLLWLATTATILILSLRIPRGILIFNYTGLFGFISNRAGIARAAWSIGNEVVFYIIFPLFVYLARRTQVGLLIFSLASLLCAAFISLILMQDATFQSQEFRHYIHPLNHLFLFVGGILIAKYGQGFKVSFSAWWLIFAVCIFVFYPVGRIEMFTTYHRFILCMVCFFISMLLFSTDMFTNPWIDRPLKLIGDISYSVYLLHPIVYLVFEKIASDVDPFFKFVSCVTLTFISSFLVYMLLEKPAMKLGSRVARAFG